MLTNPQKKQLKALAQQQTINKYRIGKNAIGETQLDLLDKALTAHELIKIEVLKACELSAMEVALDLSGNLNAEIVQLLGRNIVLYRKSKNKEIIKFKK